jgi:hypothetical protein
MIRIATLSSALLLTACGHYQHLQQDNSDQDQNAQANNRYSQGSVVLDNDNIKTESSAQKLTLIKTNQKIVSSSEKSLVQEPEHNVVTKAKKEPVNNEPGIWSQLMDILTPTKVKPWQKSILAKATMKPGGLTPGSEKFNQKIYSSKESSRGGLGVAGGGCGCN